MWPINFIFPSGRTVQLMPRHLLLGAAVIAAIAVFATYVGLLNRAVERGAEQWRAAQEAGAVPTAKVVRSAFDSAPRKRTTLVSLQAQSPQ